MKLSIDHSHHFHLPCHITRSYLEEQAKIDETDREQQTENEQEPALQLKPVLRQQNTDFKIVESRAKDNVSVTSSQAYQKLNKPVQHLSHEELYNANVLQQKFQNSIKHIPINMRALIMQKQKFIEDKVYISFSHEQANILQKIYQEYDVGQSSHYNDFLKQGLQQIMSQIIQDVEEDILLTDCFHIRKNKKAISYDEKIKRQKHKKIGQLTNSTPNSFQPNDSTRTSSQIYLQSPLQDFSLQSEKTRKADQFIKKIQKQQEEKRKLRKQEQQRKRSLEVRSMEEKKQFQQEIKSQRKNYLKRRIQAKRQIKQKQIQMRSKMNKQYKQFLQKYKQKIPLFKQKQMNFETVQQQERKREISILQKRKQYHKPLNAQQLRDHQKQYNEMKKKKDLERQKQKNFKSFQKPEAPQIKYYISKAFQAALEQQKAIKQKKQIQNPKILRSQLVKKRDQYSKSVRNNYMPKNDEAKKKQLQQIIKKIQWSQTIPRTSLNSTQRNEMGNKYLFRLHELIAELKLKGKLPAIAKTIDESQLPSVPYSKKYKNYLKEFDTSSAKRRYSIDYNEMAEYNAQDTQYTAKKLQQKAKRRQAYLNGGSLNINRAVEESKKLDEQYLQSIKAKLALLNKYEKNQ